LAIILTKLNHLSSLYVGTSVLRWARWAVGDRYSRVHGQSENQGGQTKKFFRRLAPNFIKEM